MQSHYDTACDTYLAADERLNNKLWDRFVG